MEDKNTVIDQLLCMSCLCVGRTLNKITDNWLKQYYVDILSEIPLSTLSKVSNPSVCWECDAMLRKMVAFREQVKDSYRILQTYTNENLHECLLTDVSRPPRLKMQSIGGINILPSEDDQRTVTGDEWVPSEKKHLKIEWDPISEDGQRTVTGDEWGPSEKKHLKIEWDHIDLDGNDSSADDRKDEVTDDLDTAETLNGVASSKRIAKMSTSIGSISENKATGVKRENNKNIESTCQTNEIKCEWDNVDDVDNNLTAADVYKDYDDLDIEEELREIMRGKKDKSKKVRGKERRSKKLKRDTKSPKVEKPDNTTKKILTIELSYEEMMLEREKESNSEGYVKAEYRCESCLIGFNYKKSFENHVTSKHSPDLGEYSCPVCKTIVPSIDSFTAHYKRHMRRYECSICRKRTQDIKVMQQHYYTKHEITLREYRCNICGKISNSIDTHRYHRDTHKARVQCSECDKTFIHRAGLLNHRLAVHELHNAFPCTICDKVFRWKTSLKRHLEKHDTKMTYSAPAFCAPCNISFSSVCSYQRHLKNSLKHVTQDQFRYVCDHCNRRFSDKTKLRDHIEEKHLLKTYHCHICMKPSKNRVSLDQHIRNIHKGRPNNKVCHLCGKGFPTKVQLESHIRTHTGERPFICEYCPTTFSQQSNLYKHNRQVHMNIKTKRQQVCKKPKEKNGLNFEINQQASEGSPRRIGAYFASGVDYI